MNKNGLNLQVKDAECWDGLKISGPAIHGAEDSASPPRTECEEINYPMELESKGI